MKKQEKPMMKSPLDESIDAFVLLVRAAEDQFAKACLALFELRQNHPVPELYAKIRERLPIADSFLDRMCDAAQKKLPAELLLYPSAAATYLQKLPYDKAVQHSTGTLPVVVSTQNKFDTEYRRFHQLTKREVSQVFDGDRVRQAQEQTNWLTRRRMSHAVPATPLEPYEIVDGCVLFNKDTKMTAVEIEVLLRRLRKTWQV